MNGIEQVNAYLDENYEFLKKYLEKNMPELEVIPSEGTYMAWVQTEKLQISPEELEKFFYRRCKGICFIWAADMGSILILS